MLALLQRRLAAKKGIRPPPNRAKVPVLRSVYGARLTAARARLWRPCRRGVERLHGCALCIGCLKRLHPLGWPAGNMQQSSLNRVVLDEDYGLGKMVVKLEDEAKNCVRLPGRHVGPLQTVHAALGSPLVQHVRQVLAAGSLRIDKQRDRSQARKLAGDRSKSVISMPVDGHTASTRPRQHERDPAGSNTRKRGTPATRVGRGGALVGRRGRGGALVGRRGQAVLALSRRPALHSSLRPRQRQCRGGRQLCGASRAVLPAVSQHKQQGERTSSERGASRAHARDRVGWDE